MEVPSEVQHRTVETDTVGRHKDLTIADFDRDFICGLEVDGLGRDLVVAFIDGTYGITVKDGEFVGALVEAGIPHALLYEQLLVTLFNHRVPAVVLHGKLLAVVDRRLAAA